MSLTHLAVGGFLTSINQYWCAYLTTILYAALLVAEFAFLPETLYPRAHVVAAEHDSSLVPTGEEGQSPVITMKRTKQLGLFVSSTSGPRSCGMC